MNKKYICPMPTAVFAEHIQQHINFGEKRPDENNAQR
jgi:hypothetical protein